MNPENGSELPDLFARALDLDKAARVLLLREIEARDAALAAKLERLLSAAARTASPIDRSPWRDLSADPDAAPPLPERIGKYRILSELGRGGMGRVYLAEEVEEDFRRIVAVKVIDRASFDADAVRRFRAEIRILSCLEHPGIARFLYGGRTEDGTLFLALEYVEGEDILTYAADHALSIRERLDLFLSALDAVGYAHQQGIVHRDLKPRNLLVGKDGRPRLLDFGISKLVDPDTRESASLTRTESRLLTPAYASPEQFRGDPVTPASDIYSLGVLLYELVAGARPFAESTGSALERAVLERDPEPPSVLVPQGPEGGAEGRAEGIAQGADTPAQLPRPAEFSRDLDAICLKALRKRPEERFADARELAADLRHLLAGQPVTARRGGDARVANAERVGGREETTRLTLPRGRALRAAIAATVVAAVALFLVSRWHPADARPEPVVRFTVAAPAGEHLCCVEHKSLALSQDGARLAFAAGPPSGPTRLYLRELDRPAAAPIPGAEGATDPVFSPDGQSLGFFSEGKLRRISLHGGAAQVLADATSSYGAAWGPTDEIVFALYPAALTAVSESGGVPRAVSRFEEGETFQSCPSFLPGGRVLFFSNTKEGSTHLAALDWSRGERLDLGRLETGHCPRVLPSGHLLYQRNDDLWAAPFDLDRARLTGEAVRVVESVREYAVSATGTLTYVAGSRPPRTRRLVWVGRDGTTKRYVDLPPSNYNQPRIDPRGERIAVDVIAQTQEVWIYDPTPGTFAPVTFEGLNRHPVWTPDGTRIAFMSEGGIYWQAADGSGGREQLTDLPKDASSKALDLPYSWTPDGRQLAFIRYSPGQPSEFFVVDVGERAAVSATVPAARPVFKMPTADGAPQISPDGQWLAYAAEDQRGRRQIFVRAFPGPEDVHQVSFDGGNEPQWNPRGGELFFRDGPRMMAVDIATASGFSQGRPRELFSGSYSRVWAGLVRPNYDVSPDGKEFLMLEPVVTDDALATQIEVVLGWATELARLVPVRR